MEKERLLPVLKTILILLSQNKYVALAELDYEQNMQPDYLETALKEYGGKLTIPSDELIVQQMEVFETQKPNRFYVDLPIWMDEERSDLTLSVVIIQLEADLAFTLKDLHIL
ncbi:hypothetical protein GCM10028818_60800 [Spirosoma horti]